MPDYPGGLRPDAPADFYLLAILAELQAIRAALEPPKPTTRTRKATS